MGTRRSTGKLTCVGTRRSVEAKAEGSRGSEFGSGTAWQVKAEGKKKAEILDQVQIRDHGQHRKVICVGIWCNMERRLWAAKARA
eukprot:1157686-Pelagomonas_calceolata.AAC.5